VDSLEAPRRAVSHRIDTRKAYGRCGWQQGVGGGWKAGVALVFEPIRLGW
jgi:hypothetical protein